MKPQPTRRPFDEGYAAAKEADPTNPYAKDSIEYRNFELGRAQGLKSLRGVYPAAVSQAS